MKETKTKKEQARQKAKAKYQERKAQAIEDAIAYQLEAGEKCLSYSELADIGAHFEKLAKRYGLIREFKENGII